tara:strand:+ start:1364 stop:2047 length:684 start_codon:yes stop_codon:yes gene_type:complete
MKNKAISTIPFQGFYNSLYSYAIEGEIESSLDWYTEDYGLTEAQRDTLANGYLERNVSEFYYNVSKDYAEAFIYEIERETGLSLDANFESMESPREYNFQTDRIFIELPEASAVAFVDYILANHKEQLEKLIAQRFTSCDGFWSNYKNTLEAWGDPSEWDYNQLGTCFEIFEYLENEIYDGHSIYESIHNGLIDTLNDEADKMLDECLEKRENREANERAQLKLAFA